MHRFVPALLLVFLCQPLPLSARQDKAGYLGINIRELTDAERKSSGVASGGCALDTVLAGGPADKGGLKKGEIVVAFNGQPVANAAGFSDALHKIAPGKEAIVTVVRNGKREDLKVKIGERPVKKQSTRWGGQMKFNGMDIDELMKRMPRVGVSAPKGAGIVVLPEEPDAREDLLKAAALEEGGQWSEAADIYQAMIENMPDRVLALEGIGYAGLKEHCERLLKEGPPERLKAYRANFDDVAARHFDRAIVEGNAALVEAIADDFSLTTNGENYLLTAGVMAMEQGRLNEAIYFFRRLLRFYPDSRFVPSVVLPRLWQCLQAQPGPEGVDTIESVVGGRNLREAKVTANRKETTLGAFLGGGSSASTAGVAAYRIPQQYFLPGPTEPGFGPRKWQARLSAKDGIGLPVASTNALFYEDAAGVGHAVDLATGAARDGLASDLLPATIKTPGMKPWEVAPDTHAIKARLAATGSLFLCYEFLETRMSNTESRLCRIDRDSGRIVWTTILCSATRAQASENPYALTLAAGTLYVATNIGVVAAVDAASGAVRWMSAYESKTSVGSKRRFFIEENNAPTLTPRQAREQFRMTPSPIVVAGNTAILLPTDHDALLAFDAETGKQIWKYAVNRTLFPNLEGVAGNRAILTMQGAVVAVDCAKGTEVWKKAVAGFAPCGKGALTATALYSPVWDGVCRVDLATGASSVVHKWSDPETEAGSLMLLPAGVVTVSPAAVTLFGK